MKETLGPIYTTDSKGKQKHWSISVESLDNDTAKIVTQYGYIDGKITVNEELITKGKNIGKKNETSPYQQALINATSKYNKQIKKSNTGYKPMLAHDYHSRAHDIKFPCFVQPKLDGVRAVIYKESNEILIQTRSGDFYSDFDDLRQSLQSFFTKYNIVLDGELYTKELSFEELTGLCRRKTKSKEQLEKLKIIKFHIFDLYDLNNTKLSFSERYKLLENVKKSLDPRFTEIVHTELIDSSDCMKIKFNEFMSQGYEGIMLRNINGAYKINQRSKDLQKYKEFTDSEFKIIDFTEGTGIEKGLIIYICEYLSKDGNTKSFNVRPEGTHESRRSVFINASKNPETIIGKMLSVKYQELTADLCPRFPVGIVIRDYE